MKKSDWSTHYSSRPYLVLFSIVSLTAVLLISVIYYGIQTANELTATYRMQIQAAHMIKFETTKAHLWFEEIISGDEHESIDTVNQHIQTSLWYARSLLYGARNSEGEFPPVEDAELRNHLEESLGKQQAYRDIINNRYRIFKEEGEAQAGSKTDQKTDKLYKEFIQIIEMIESELNAVIEQRWSDFIKTEIALTAMLLLVCVLCTWVIIKLFNQKDRIAATLKESSENLRITLESIGDGVIATDKKGFITMLNPVAEGLTGWHRNEAVGLKMEEVFNIKSAVTGRKAENPVDRVIETGSVVGLANHTVLVSKHGSEHQIADSGAPIINRSDSATRGDSVTGVIVVFRDVTEEYEKEQRVKESEESLRLFFDNIPLAVFAHDMEGNFIFINSTSAEYTGYTERELIDLKVSDIDAQSSSRDDREKIWNRLRYGEKEYLETTHYRKDGSYYLAGVSIASIVYKGKPVLLAIAKDITEHKHAEAALKESQDMLAKTLEATNDGIWDWNLETDEVYFSPRYYEMAGYTPDEFPHRFDEFKKRVHPEDTDYVLNNAEDHLKGKTSRFIIEFRFRKKNGDWLWLMGRGKIVERDENGNPQRMTGTHTDITERKSAEYALLTEKERLAVTLKS
ncbi:MAG: PAS domain-containing protein, partial [Chitinivibrionales bacterium]